MARGAGHWGLVGLAWGSAAAIVALRWLTVPAAAGHGTHEQLGLPACAMMVRTGWPCPGCGVTTSLSHLSHGELARAFAVQPFGALAGLTIVAAALWTLAATLLGRDAWADFRAGFRPWMAWTLAAAWAASWAWKLLEFAPR